MKRLNHKSLPSSSRTSSSTNSPHKALKAIAKLHSPVASKPHLHVVSDQKSVFTSQTQNLVINPIIKLQKANETKQTSITSLHSMPQIKIIDFKEKENNLPKNETALCKQDDFSKYSTILKEHSLNKAYTHTDIYEITHFSEINNPILNKIHNNFFGQNFFDQNQEPLVDKVKVFYWTESESKARGIVKNGFKCKRRVNEIDHILGPSECGIYFCKNLDVLLEYLRGRGVKAFHVIMAQVNFSK